MIVCWSDQKGLMSDNKLFQKFVPDFIAHVLLAKYNAGNIACYSFAAFVADTTCHLNDALGLSNVCGTLWAHEPVFRAY